MPKNVDEQYNFILDLLREGPKTCEQLVDAFCQKGYFDGTLDEILSFAAESKKKPSQIGEFARIRRYIKRLHDMGFPIQTGSDYAYYLVPSEEGEDASLDGIYLGVILLQIILEAEYRNKKSENECVKINDSFLFSEYKAFLNEHTGEQLGDARIKTRIEKAVKALEENDLIENDLIRCENGGESHVYRSKGLEEGNAVFRYEDLLNATKWIISYGKTSPHREELNLILGKLRKKIPKNDFSEIKIIGRKNEVSKQINAFREMMLEAELDKYVCRIIYKARKRTKPSKCLFRLGLAYLDADKDEMYLLGKNEKNQISSIKFRTIQEIETLEDEHDQYGLPEYDSIYKEMLSASVDQNVHEVKLRVWDRKSKNGDGINRERFQSILVNTRESAEITEDPDKSIDPDEKEFFLYRDRIRGIEELARFLRGYGDEVEILEPIELKKKFYRTGQRMKMRYEFAESVCSQKK